MNAIRRNEGEYVNREGERELVVVSKAEKNLSVCDASCMATQSTPLLNDDAADPRVVLLESLTSPSFTSSLQRAVGMMDVRDSRENYTGVSCSRRSEAASIGLPCKRRRRRSSSSAFGN